MGQVMPGMVGSGRRLGTAVMFHVAMGRVGADGAGEFNRQPGKTR